MSTVRCTCRDYSESEDLMPKPDLVILIINAVFVTVAVALNFRAARRGIVRFRSLHTAACVLGCIYIAGYVWLFCQLLYSSGDDAAQVLRWSATFRGISDDCVAGDLVVDTDRSR
jgi:hypothetical protein